MAAWLDGISAALVQTARTQTHILSSGAGTPVVFVHGNVSAARFFEETMLAMPDGFQSIAVDLRGFGRSAPDPIDATRGVRDFSDDIVALLDAQEISGPVHLVGWSVGGGVVLQVAIDHPERVASLTLINPMAPFGFAGTRGAEGAPCCDDFAGSGAGTANPEFVKRLQAKDTGSDDTSPRTIMNSFYFKPPFRSDREEVLLGELLLTQIGDDHYPGELAASPNWPLVGPAGRGMNNAISPRYTDLSAFAEISPRPPVLWIRGADDQIVSDTSLFDIGHLGALGAIPGWPGAEAYPAQPMVAQTRALLERYAAAGGQYEEVVIDDCGHSPHVEKPEAFQRAFHSFLAR